MRAAGDVSNCVGEAPPHREMILAEHFIETAKTIAFQRMTAKCKQSLTFYSRVYVYSSTVK
jgi:hypothetical protein